MKRDEERKRDWLEEVWRVKEELAVEAKRMGLREYLAFAEKEAEKILRTRSKPAPLLARDKQSR